MSGQNTRDGLYGRLDTEKLHNKIVEKFADAMTCPFCHSDNWTVSEILFGLAEMHNYGIILGGDVVPLVVSQCENCSYIVSFNALTLGIINSKGQINQEYLSEKEDIET